MQHGSINFSWVLIQVLKLKSDHPDPQSTVDSHMCPLTKKVIISVLQLMSCLSKCLNPTTSHLYAYVPTWMMPVKTCRKSPSSLLHVYSILYFLSVPCPPCGCACVLACTARWPCGFYLCSGGTRSAVNGIDKERWTAQDRGGCKAREKEMEGFLQL